MRLCASVVVAGLASSVHAQGEASWSWSITTDDGDEVVEAGESAEITLSVRMMPTDEKKLASIGGAFFDTSGGLNADNGMVTSWLVLNELAMLTGDTTTTDGVSLFGTSASQLYGVDPFVQENPVDVLRFVWKPDVYSTYQVEYHTSTASILNDVNVPGFIDVYTGFEPPNFDLELWAIEEAAVQFQVVPSPMGSLLFLGAFLAARRRRP